MGMTCLKYTDVDSTYLFLALQVKVMSVMALCVEDAPKLIALGNWIFNGKRQGIVDGTHAAWSDETLQAI